MKTDSNGSRLTRIMAAAAVVVGLGAGSYGIASAASGTNSTATGTEAQSTPAAPDANHPWGGQRSDETPLTGDTLAKVTAAAKAEVPNATIVRVETDADGHAAYEAHIVKGDGTPATVYVDKQFNVVSVETR
jgi:uncharacterized membrane protein YkoI